MQTDSPSTVFEQIIERPIIPVVVIDNAGDAPGLAEALLNGGIDVIEITLRTPAALEAIEQIARDFPDMLVGAGTVLTKSQADSTIDSGASFALAPGLNTTVVNHYRDKNKLFIPGVMTPTEIEQGLAHDCRLLKFFPASIGGPDMLKALAGPYASRGIRFCPTGGINLDNMNDYLNLDIVSSIGGSWIATKQQIKNRRWSVITVNAKRAMAAARGKN